MYYTSSFKALSHTIFTQMQDDSTVHNYFMAKFLFVHFTAICSHLPPLARVVFSQLLTCTWLNYLAQLTAHNLVEFIGFASTISCFEWQIFNTIHFDQQLFNETTPNDMGDYNQFLGVCYYISH